MILDSTVFLSLDIEKVIPFYRDVLGFKLEYQQGDKFVSFIFSNNARLAIKRQSEPREVPGHQTVFVGVDKIDKVYDSLKRKHVLFYKELVEQSWGKEFSLLDADGNKVLFIQRK